MLIAPIRANEPERISVLEAYSIMDSGPDRQFDEIVELASSICETPISLVTLIDEKRQWFKARYGLETPETSRDVAFCAHAILQNEVMVVDDASKDERFFDNPLVTGDPDIRFYAGMPLITPNGYNMGTLCVIDRKPRTLSDSQLYSLQVLSRQVVKQMELHKMNIELNRLIEVDSKLLSIIAHDLRSPLASIHSVLEVAEKHQISAEKLKAMVPEMRRSVATGLDLVTNLLDWAVTQFSGKNSYKEFLTLKAVADSVIENNKELFANKNNAISNEIEVSLTVFADKKKIEFIFRNLLLNANKFTSGGEISLSAVIKGKSILTCVSDTGTGIDDSMLKQIFLWENKVSKNGTNGEKGSGLGLPMCREFVESEGGDIWAKSSVEEGTKMFFNLPLPMREKAFL